MSYNALEVDVTGWWISRLGERLTAHVASDTPDNLETRLPWVRVIRVGGGDDGIVLDQASMIFHCYAVSEQAANALAYSVGTAIRSLRGVPVAGAVLSAVAKSSGPTWNPHENPAVKEAVMSYRTTVKTTF